jgi:hypothetical protein
VKSLLVMSSRTPQKCVKVFRQINGCLATKDYHDSWGMCTTSIECKTVITVTLTVMSRMDPHTIRVTWIGMVGMLGVRSILCLGQTAAMDSVVCSMSRFEEKRC